MKLGHLPPLGFLLLGSACSEDEKTSSSTESQSAEEELKHPFTKELHFASKVLIWSLGPDGQSGTPETDEDNIYS